jgi:hypothetical protein
MRQWLQRLKANQALLRREVEAEGRRFESMSYDDLRNLADAGGERIVEGRRLLFSAETYHIKDNGDLSVCVDAAGLPTLFGVKPSYRFHKRPDGSVYY